MAKVRLWFCRETEKARLYCKHNRPCPDAADMIWVPRSIVEHTTKLSPIEHVLELPDWFVEKEGL